MIDRKSSTEHYPGMEYVNRARLARTIDRATRHYDSTALAASTTQHQWYAVLYAVCCMLYAVCCMLACAGCRVQVCRTVSADRRRGGIGCTHETGLWAGRSERCIRRSLPSRLTWGFRLEVSPIPFRQFRQPLPVDTVSSVSLAHTSSEL